MLRRDKAIGPLGELQQALQMRDAVVVTLEEDANCLALEDRPLPGPPLLIGKGLRVPVRGQYKRAGVFVGPELPELRCHEVEEGREFDQVALVVIEGHQLRDDVRRAIIRTRLPDQWVCEFEKVQKLAGEIVKTPIFEPVGVETPIYAVDFALDEQLSKAALCSGRVAKVPYVLFAHA